MNISRKGISEGCFGDLFGDVFGDRIRLESFWRYVVEMFWRCIWRMVSIGGHFRDMLEMFLRFGRRLCLTEFCLEMCLEIVFDRILVGDLFGDLVGDCF